MKEQIENYNEEKGRKITRAARIIKKTMLERMNSGLDGTEGSEIWKKH